MTALLLIILYLNTGTVFDNNSKRSVSSHPYLSLILSADYKEMSLNSFLPCVRFFNVHLRYSHGFLICTARHTKSLPSEDAQCYAFSKPVTWLDI